MPPGRSLGADSTRTALPERSGVPYACLHGVDTATVATTGPKVCDERDVGANHSKGQGAELGCSLSTRLRAITTA